MENHMLLSLCKEVGLGSPQPYYQNNSECMNKVIKDQMNYRENELPEFLEKVTSIALRHETLLRKAVANWRMGTSWISFRRKTSLVSDVAGTERRADEDLHGGGVNGRQSH